DPQIAAAAQEVAGAIGHDTAVIDEKTVLGLDEGLAPQLQQQNLVLVGNAWNNRAIFRLYIRELALCDLDYPGAAGWIVRTVCAPWTAEHNAIIVGASGAGDLGRAAEAFAGDLQRDDGRVVLPWAWRFESGVSADGARRFTRRSYSEAELAEYREQITYTDQPLLQFPSDIIGQALTAGERYYQTGNPLEMQRFQMALDALAEMGDLLHEARHVEFRLKDLVIAWERMEADPFFSDAQRAENAALFYSLGRLWEDRYWSSPGLARRVQESLRPVTNHPSNGTLGYMRLGMYLLRACELSPQAAEDAQHWVESADIAFNGQEQSFKTGCDANGYQWWSTKHMIKYALWRPDYDVFWNGNARLMGDLILATADNMGNAAGFGDVGANLRGYSSHAQYILSLASRHYGDGSLRWIAEYLHGRLPDARVPVESVTPIDATGVVRIPWSRAYYDDLATRGGKYTRVPWARTFDKIAFRAGFESDEPYMLLDGIGGMGHGHDDCNAITRISADGTVWVIDTAYALKTMYDHNGVFVARDGRSSGEAYAAELEAFADLQSAGMTRTQSAANGLSWNRNIFWLKDGLFVVADEMTCVEAGDYQTNSTWRFAMEGSLESDTYTARDLDRAMVIAGDGTGRPKAAWERHMGEVPAHVLRQVVSREMSPGDDFAYANALAWPQRPEDAPAITKIAGQAWRVERNGEVIIVATGAQTPAGIQTDARMLLIDADTIALVDATECTLFGSELLRASRPVTVELGRDGAGVVLCGEDASEEPVSVSLALGGDVRIGGETVETAAEATTRVEPGAGRHLLEYTAAEQIGSVLDRLQNEASGWPEAVADDAADAADVERAGKSLWSYEGVREMLPHSVQAVTADPPCKPGRSSPVEKLVDGDWRVSTVSGIWQIAEAPEVTLDFGKSVSIDRVEIYTWEGMDDHKLAGVDMATGDDQENLAPVNTEFPIVGQAERDISRIREADELDARGRYLRLTFNPATPEDSAYVAEVVVYPAEGEGDGVGQINDIATWDLSGDGADEVLIAGSDGALHCLGGDGTVQWKFEVDEGVNAVWVGQLHGETAVLVGGEDNHLYRLDADGQEVWRQRTYGFRPTSYETGRVREIEVARLRPDEQPVILVGADNWQFSAFTASGEELWHTYYYSHSTTFIDTGDINGDGVQEIFLGTSFADTNWIDADGEASQFQRTRIGPAAAGVAADLDGDGTDEMIAVGQTGIAASTVTETEAGEWEHEELWRVNTGCPQTSIVAADVDGDGSDDLVTAGKNGFIWALGAGGEVHWLRNAHNSINDLLVTDIDGAPVILAASDDGTVQMWSMQGDLLRSIEVGLQVLRITVADVQGDGGPEILAVTTDGTIHAIEV
ncbi:MAG: FG-GAP repeat domain-containing protein, partial [Armatimonadota bacterium]